MASAAVTPRVRAMVICDGVKESETEANVFHLKGVRSYVHAAAFPFAPERMRLFLLLSSARPGRFEGNVRVMDDQTERIIFYTKIFPTFQEGPGFLPYRVPIHCRFPGPGTYTFQVRFFRLEDADILRGEQTFWILEERSE